MRRILFAFSLILGLLSVPTQLFADDGQKKTVRFFLNTGETLDFDAAEIDSITTTLDKQTVWLSDTCFSYDVEAIDSVWYMTPTLRLTTESLNFGKVAVGKRKSIYVTVTNTGPYTETYSLFADGVFKAVESGLNFEIDANESQDAEITFTPTDSVVYDGKLLLESSALGDGLFSLELVGKGVATDSLEEIFMLPPVEEDFSVVLPNEQDPESLAGFKIVNSYGEFPISMASAVKARRAVRNRANETGFYTFGSNGFFSPNGLQLHTLLDGNDNAWLFSISLPDEKPEISFRQTAITLLMTEPLLITSNEAEYRNTVNAITKLKSFDKLVDDVRDTYYDGVNHYRCPDYSHLNVLPVMKELADEVRDNSNLRLSGVSLKDVNRMNTFVSYRVSNDFKRVLHIYPRRLKMTENTGVIESSQDVSQTLAELCEWMLTSSNLVANELDKEIDKEELEFIEDLKEWIVEIEKTLVSFGLGDADSHICVPIILDSEKSNYWKIVKGSLKGEKSSPFLVETGTITTELDGYDKVYLDIYGLGGFNKTWNEYSGKDKLRIAFAMIHGAYKDFIKPLMEVTSGWKELKEASGYDDYNYDFRYGARKYPKCALVAKLLLNFGKDLDNFQNIYEKSRDGDWWELAKDVLVFLYDELCKMPSESKEDKRSYTNLIYNIYKKYTKTPATSKAFRDGFKKLANNITHLKTANFIGKTIKLSEAGLDLVGGGYAAVVANAMETFKINKTDHPCIDIIKPDKVLKSEEFFGAENTTIQFEWDIFKGDFVGNFNYDLEIVLDKPDEFTRIAVLKGIEETHCEYNLANLSIGKDVKRILFRIVAHHPLYPQVVYVMTKDTPLADFVTEWIPDFYDLGLPSGTLWAGCNLGATQAESYGDYYAWGETEANKGIYAWNNYKYCNKVSNALTKYCTKSVYGNNGFTDGLTELKGSDDPVSTMYGYYYSIPTKEEWDELIANCKWQRHMNGVVARGPNGNILYFPLAGYWSGYELNDAGSEGYYWSSTLDEYSPDDAWFFYVGPNKHVSYDYYRSQGRSIRPVLHVAPLAPPESAQQSPAHKAVKSASPIEKHEDGLIIKTTNRTTSIQ